MKMIYNSRGLQPEVRIFSRGGIELKTTNCTAIEHLIRQMSCTGGHTIRVSITDKIQGIHGLQGVVPFLKVRTVGLNGAIARICVQFAPDACYDVVLHATGVQAADRGTVQKMTDKFRKLHSGKWVSFNDALSAVQNHVTSSGGGTEVSDPHGVALSSGSPTIETHSVNAKTPDEVKGVEIGTTTPDGIPDRDSATPSPEPVSAAAAQEDSLAGVFNDDQFLSLFLRLIAEHVGREKLDVMTVVTTRDLKSVLLGAFASQTGLSLEHYRRNNGIGPVFGSIVSRGYLARHKLSGKRGEYTLTHKALAMIGVKPEPPTTVVTPSEGKKTIDTDQASTTAQAALNTALRLVADAERAEQELQQVISQIEKLAARRDELQVTTSDPHVAQARKLLELLSKLADE